MDDSGTLLIKGLKEIFSGLCRLCFISLVITSHIMAKPHFPIFFLSGFSFIYIDESQDCREKQRVIFIPLFQFYPLEKIYLQLCMWDYLLPFLVASHVKLPDCYSYDIFSLWALVFDWMFVVALLEDSMSDLITSIYPS